MNMHSTYKHFSMIDTSFLLKVQSSFHDFTYIEDSALLPALIWSKISEINTTPSKMPCACQCRVPSWHCIISIPGDHTYCQTSNISRDLVRTKSPRSTSSFSIQHMASMDWAKATAGRDEKHLALRFVVPYIRGLTVLRVLRSRVKSGRSHRHSKYSDTTKITMWICLYCFIWFSIFFQPWTCISFIHGSTRTARVCCGIYNFSLILISHPHQC